MDDILYDKRYECLACEMEFTTKKVRSNKVRTISRDSDLCSYFEGVNPYYYEGNVCPQCGFAFTDSFTPLRANQKELIYADYTKRYLPQGAPNLCGIRNENEAITSFKLALGAGFTKGEQPRILAGICMRIAWLHRLAKNTAEELEFLEAANRFFHVAYETQQDSSSDAQFLHMLGDISLRLSKLDQARQWFSQLFTPTHASYAHIELAREAWAARKHE